MSRKPTQRKVQRVNTSSRKRQSAVVGEVRRRQLVVLGMHRSGTSATTGMLQAFGAYVGREDELTRRSPENPRGFFERRDACRICDALLQKSGADWWKVLGFDVDRISPELRKTLRPAIRDLIAHLDAQGTWAIKEPRLCLLLPVFEEELTDPVVVFVVRNPLEVAKSLNRRNAFPIDYGLALWEAYNVAALKNSAHLPRVVVSYKELIDRPRDTMETIVSQLRDLGVVGLDASNAGTAIDGMLHCERADIETLHSQLTDAQQALWTALQSGHLENVTMELSESAKATLAMHEAEQAGRGQFAARAQALVARLQVKYGSGPATVIGG